MHDIISLFSCTLNQSLVTKKNVCVVPYTRVLLTLSSLLYKENLIYSYRIDLLNNSIIIFLNQLNNTSNIYKIERISKPSKRIQWSIKQLSRKVIKEGRFYIISTSSGIITSNEALKLNISGEILMQLSF